MDKGHRYADKILADIIDDMQGVFDDVDRKAIKKLQKYLKQFEDEIKEHKQMVEDGEITQREFEQWYVNHVTTGRKWEEVRDEIAQDYHEATVKAMAKAGSGLFLVYQFNKSFSINQIIKQTKSHFRSSVPPRRPKRITPKSPDPLKNLPWHRKKIESIIRSGMKKGHSVDKIAKRLHKVTKMDRVAAYRTVRTAVTCAENEARIDAMMDAQDKLGIAYDKIWYATLDDRTRVSHRVIHGERVPCDAYFSNDMFEPGDPNGPDEEVYNCRCTLLWAPAGMPMDIEEGPDGMGKLEWSAQKPVSKPYPRWRDG